MDRVGTADWECGQFSAPAEDGVGEDNAAFYRAATAVTLACDAAGSIVSYGALPEMGG